MTQSTNDIDKIINMEEVELTGLVYSIDYNKRRITEAEEKIKKDYERIKKIKETLKLLETIRR